MTPSISASAVSGFVIPLFMVVPLLLGVFLGAPLIAREVEQGTHRLAWTQSVTRGRWASTKIGLVSVFTLLAAGLFAWMVSIWSSPLVAAADDRFGFGVFDLRGIVPIAYAMFAVALGTAVGASIRKTLPAMAITLGVFAVVRIVVELFLRPRYLPHEDRLVSVRPEQPSRRAGRLGALFEDHRSDRTFVSSNGAITVNPSALAQACPGLSGPGVFPGKDQVGSCLSQLGVRIVDTYQPGSRYWLFQGIESAIFLALAAGLVVFAMWQIRRRIS
jgi:hypothetical protein